MLISLGRTGAGPFTEKKLLQAVISWHQDKLESVNNLVGDVAQVKVDCCHSYCSASGRDQVFPRAYGKIKLRV